MHTSLYILLAALCLFFYKPGYVGAHSLELSPSENTTTAATTQAAYESENKQGVPSRNEQFFAQSSCESQVKSATQELRDLRLELQTLQLQQDLASVRSQLRHLQQKQEPSECAAEVLEGGGEHSDGSAQQGESTTEQSDEANNGAAVGKSVYVRWGARSCPDGASMVYTGVVGGGMYSVSGSGVNALCLPLNPVYDDQKPTTWNANLYGAEFDTLPDSYHDLDVVCAVCEIPRPLTLMVPATNVCHPGWTLEYAGYLMTGFGDHASGSEFICMDSKRETRIGSSTDANGKLFYYTLGKCGSLPCPPYVEGKVVLCSLCSK